MDDKKAPVEVEARRVQMQEIEELEAFSGDDYTAAGAMLVLPGAEDTGAALFAEGGACQFNVTVTQANSAWNR